MSCEIIIRRAREEDAMKRAELIQMGLMSHQWDAFIYFLLQELTLECVLLSSAVLFIFFGAAPACCALLLPAAAALVAAIVAVTHHALASAHAQRMHGEVFGLVAEARGPLSLGPPPGPVPVRVELQHCSQTHDVHSKVVGTLSVSAYSAPGGYSLGQDEGAGWLHALAVHTQWRRRGVGRALAGAARCSAAGQGLRALEALTSDLQRPARALLHSQGWQCRGTYDRRLLGAALTLQLARLGLDLPHA